jgi:hypothetical protein
MIHKLQKYWKASNLLHSNNAQPSAATDKWDSGIIMLIDISSRFHKKRTGSSEETMCKSKRILPLITICLLMGFIISCALPAPVAHFFYTKTPTSTPTPAATATPTATPQPPLNLAPCPYYDMCPDALFIHDLMPENHKPDMVYNVDVPYDRPISFYIGWIAMDYSILAQNLENMRFFVIIDGQNYWDDSFMGMPEPYVYENEPNTEYATQGAGVEISGWKIGQSHEVRIGYSINEEINDGWDTYSSGTVIENVYTINPIIPPLETATATGIPPTATPGRSATGKIEGRVYRSDSNQSIANVTVILISEGGSGTFEEKIVSVTTTDLNGYYSLEAVEPAAYSLWISLEKLPEFVNYPFCSNSIPEDWIVYLTGYSVIPLALLPPNMEFSVAAGDGLLKDIDMAVIKCNKP